MQCHLQGPFGDKCSSDIAFSRQILVQRLPGRSRRNTDPVLHTKHWHCITHNTLALYYTQNTALYYTQNTALYCTQNTSPALHTKHWPGLHYTQNSA